MKGDNGMKHNWEVKSGYDLDKLIDELHDKQPAGMKMKSVKVELFGEKWVVTTILEGNL